MAHLNNEPKQYRDSAISYSRSEPQHQQQQQQTFTIVNDRHIACTKGIEVVQDERRMLHIVIVIVIVVTTQ